MDANRVEALREKVEITKLTHNRWDKASMMIDSLEKFFSIKY